MTDQTDPRTGRPAELRRGQMSLEQLDAFKEWINGKLLGGEDYRCECCGHQNWMLNDMIVQGIEIEMMMSPMILPCASMSCSNCNNIKFFNANRIGLLTSRFGKRYDAVAPAPAPKTEGTT